MFEKIEIKWLIAEDVFAECKETKKKLWLIHM